MTWKLEKALGNIPYDQFGVSEEVQEQVKSRSLHALCSCFCKMILGFDVVFSYRLNW